MCNLEWCKNANEIISTHGFPHNQIVVWNYPSMGKVCCRILGIQNVMIFFFDPSSLFQVATLTGHSLRVLYLAMSPDRKVFFSVR